MAEIPADPTRVALPWELGVSNPGAPAPLPEEEVQEFVSIPLSTKDAHAPPPPAPQVLDTSTPERPHDWSVRESDKQNAPIIIPAAPEPPPPGPTGLRGAVSTAWQNLTEEQRKGLGLGLLAGAVAVMAVIVLASTAGLGRTTVTLLHTDRVYHTPVTLAGAPRELGPIISAPVAAERQRVAALAVSGAKTASAGYLSGSGQPGLLLSVAQDNIGRALARSNSGLIDQFPNLDQSTLVSETVDGVNVTCGTVVDPGTPYQACSWYNAFAFGFLIDRVSPNPSASETLLAPALTSMVG